jgi:GNAT superfamily N-acetyltransferase
MIIKTEKSKAIMNFLKENLLVNLNTIGAIENIPEAEIFVDDVENPKGVIVKKGYFYYIYSEEDSFIDEFANTFLKDGFYGFAGIDAAIATRIKKKFQVSWENPCTLYYLPKENLDLSLIKNPVQDIDLKDLEIIDKYYEFRHPGSIEAIRKDIEFRPSSAVYVDGEPVCWVVVHDDNSMGIMYTREEHRRKGYAVDVTMDLAAKIYERGMVPYLQIIERNNMSPGLAKKCNFVKCGEVSWFGIISGLPKEFINANKESRKQFVLSFSCGERYLPYLDKPKQEERYLLLDKLKENYELAEGFTLKQVENEEMMNIWSNIVCKGYEIPDEHTEEFKKMLLVLKDNSSYKFYIGYENGEPVSSSALLKLDHDTCGMYFTSTLPSYRNKGIGASTIIEILKDAKKNKKELIIIQAPEEYISLFKNLGFVTNFDKEI